MNRFKNILVVYSQAKTANLLLRRAAALAWRNEARLTVVEAFGGFLYHMPILISKTSPKELNKQFAYERCEYLKEQISKIIKYDIQLNVKVLIGTPFLEIIRAVMREHYDLVVATSERRKGLNGHFFDRTALHLMRKCPCPVWIMKPDQNKPFSEILAAVDPDLSNVVKHTLNIKIMDLATSLAQQENSKLHVVHAWSPRREHFLRYTKMSVQEVDQVTQQLLTQRRKQLDDFVAPYAVDKQVHYLLDEPGIAIPDLVTKQHIDLIVMGTICRTGLAGLIIGSTAENVLQQVECSILAVKPEGFVSPVET
ncbi:universal stress protein [Planctomycetota bacterium]